MNTRHQDNSVAAVAKTLAKKWLGSSGRPTNAINGRRYRASGRWRVSAGNGTKESCWLRSQQRDEQTAWEKIDAVSKNRSDDVVADTRRIGASAMLRLMMCCVEV